MADECPVCNCELTGPPNETFETDVTSYACPNCGTFALDLKARSTRALLQERPAVLSHAIWKRQVGGQTCLLGIEDIQWILENEALPTPVERGELAILYIGAQTQHDPARFMEPRTVHLPAKFGANDDSNVCYILENVAQKGLVDSRGDSARARCRLTLAGWEKHEELMRGVAESRRAFMAMPFGDAQLDAVFARFRQAVDETGFDLKRVDERPRPGLIDDHLRVDIRTARFVVAELTKENRGVYWEAGYAEGLGKPVIYTCEESHFKEKETHFDTNHHLTIRWEENNLDAAAEELKATIRNALPADAKMTDEDQS